MAHSCVKDEEYEKSLHFPCLFQGIQGLPKQTLNTKGLEFIETV